MRLLKLYRSPNEGGGTPQAGNNPPAPPAGSGNPPAPPANDTQDVKSLPDWAQATINNLRKENADYRTRSKDRDELAAKVKEIEDANLSELQKAQNRAKELETAHTETLNRLRQSSVERAIERSARKLGIVDEEAALALLDKSRLEFEGDTPKNVEALLTDLVKAKPYLVQGAMSPTSSTNPASGGGGGGFSLEALKQMTPQQIAKLPEAEYQKLLTAQTAR